MEEPRKRITARVSDSVRDTLEQAAELLGATVNQFVVQTAYVEAQRVIERESVIRLSQKDARMVLQHIADLWGYDVVMTEVDAATDAVLKDHKAQARPGIVPLETA